MHIFLIAVLILATTSAWADWVKYAETDEAVLYFDPATIRKDGNLRRVWKVYDLKERGSDGELSRRILEEYDCIGERWRTISLSAHSGSVASGEVLFDGIFPDTWHYVPPRTISEHVFKLVCAE
jgi:hypothetical protein